MKIRRSKNDLKKEKNQTSPWEKSERVREKRGGEAKSTGLKKKKST